MSEFGYNFIPPYCDTGTQANLNLNLMTAIQPEKPPGDHGYSAIPGHSGSIAKPYHAESSGIPFHHYKDDSASHYIAEGHGFFSNVIVPNQYGTPWKTEQGAVFLWQNFFKKHFTITEDEWSKDSDFYHSLFGKYLSSFVHDFLPAVVKIAKLNYSALVKAQSSTCDDVADCAKMKKYMHDLATSFPNYLGLIISPGGTSENAVHANIRTILTKALEKSYSFSDIKFVTTTIDSSSTVEVTASPSNPTDEELEQCLQRWFLGVDSGKPSKTMYQDDVAANPSPSDLAKIWSYFMSASDIKIRHDRALAWSYSVMITVLNALQMSAEVQSQRVSALTSAQKSSTSAMIRISLPVITSMSDLTGTTDKKRAQAYIAIYRSARQRIQEYTHQQASIANTSNQNFKQQTSLITTMVQTIDSLIQFILRK